MKSNYLIALQPGEKVEIIVHYTTNEKTTAINWLEPSQTAGKNLPYLFTQCETIACRSIAPMMDTPSIKITYDADVTVSEEFVVHMSANLTGVMPLPTTKQKVYSFKNQIKMPSYLIAIAVGNLEQKEVGRRCSVITEPEQMDMVSKELEDLEQMLDGVENYLTPYIWGNYSILVLPPSFPVGGMENPLLTFASPTIITGDKSQVYVATHEIAHSWTGNDVTCKNWEHFWLNEGFTVFEERKVSAQLYGEEFAKVEALLGNFSMYEDMKNYGLDDVYSSLHPTLKGDNPDSSFSEVPYEKGFQLLTFLESFVGPELFQTFLRSYILEYSQQSILADDLRRSWEDFVQDNYNAADTNRILGSINWDAWLYTPGLPPTNTLDFSTPASDGASALADEYIKLAGVSSPEDKDKFKAYYSNLKVVFLERLNERIGELNLALLQLLDTDFDLTNTLDPEVKQRWFPIGIKLNYDAVTEPAHTFISSQGRMKYLNPIYIALRDNGKRDLAITWLNENIGFYHPMAVVSVKKILGLSAAEPKEVEFIEF